MKTVRIALIALAGAVDIYVETDTAVIVPEVEEKDGEELPERNPLDDMPPAVKRIFDISRVRKFDSILEFSMWCLENETVVSRVVIL